MSSFPVIELNGDQINVIRVKDLGFLLLHHSKQLLANHGKTLPQMAQTGLGWIEVRAILEGRPDNSDDCETEAKTMVLKMLEEHQRQIVAQEEADHLEVERQESEQRREKARRLALRPRFLDIRANCKDLCDLTLLSEHREEIAGHDGYVPDGLGIGDAGGDVEMTIDLDSGMIVGWKRPSDKALRRFIRRVQ